MKEDIIESYENEKKEELIDLKEIEKMKKEEKKSLKNEQKIKEKDFHKSMNNSKKNKKSGHVKLNSSIQFMPNNFNDFLVVEKELPESFFEDILIKEMELSEEFTIEKLTSLIKLYSKGMEHYIQSDPQKAVFYQSRMELLLTNRDTLKKLKKESENLSLNNKKKINTVNNNNIIIGNNSEKNLIKTNTYKAEMKKNIEYKTDNLIFDDIEQKVNKVMGDSGSKKEKSTGISIIEEDIQKQNLSWKEKLQKKKKGIIRNNMNFAGNKQSFDSIKRKSANVKSSNDDKLNIGEKNVEKMKFIFNEDIYDEVKEVKEENEGEESDKENKKEEKEERIDNFENIKIVNDVDDENLKKVENLEENKEKEKKNENKIEVRPNIVEQDVIRNVDIDEKILNSVNQRFDLLMKLLDDIENKKIKENDDENLEGNNNNNIINEIKNDKNESNELFENQAKIINVPVKFQNTYYQVENLMKTYMDNFNNYYYKDIFELFSSELKEIYDKKYKKYIEISLEYHNHIKENEHILENNDNLSEEKKVEIKQIIDSLKEEQQNEIAKIEDEFNRLIVSKVNEFKINSFKNNSGIQLIEEQLKLDIYSLINNAFY